jgi:hypothetical protein
VALHRTLNAQLRYNTQRVSVPAADQRVPHIWPSFGQMWETRTSTLISSAHSAKALKVEPCGA